jgi:predicted regulator of Ras-like GTPase activity (Roadblock/LC7/MglB family)
MAGRKPPSKPDLMSQLLGKIGLAQPKKGKKKKRKGPPRPRPDAYTAEASPFGDYAQESGLGFNDAGYEAAAAAGYAPPPPPSMEPLFPDAEPTLPIFGSSPVTPSATPAPPSFAAAVASAAPPAPGKIFNEDALDSSLDALFAGLEMGSAPAAAEVPNNIVSFPGAAAPIEPPSFVPEPEPMPAASRAPVLPEEPAPAPAPVVTKAPSRPLPVTPAYEASGPVPPAAVVTLSQGQDLRTLLATIDRTPGVTGSLLVGYDGLIIAFTLPPTVDRDFLAAQACAMFTSTGQQTERLERGELRRMVLETSTGAMLMTAADMGILVVVSDGQAIDVRAVAASIAGALGQG